MPGSPYEGNIIMSPVDLILEIIQVTETLEI